MQKHSREGYSLAALLRRVEGRGWKGFWPCRGDSRWWSCLGWDVESGGTASVLVADCQWPQSRTCLKPETMRVTFEEFKRSQPYSWCVSPTHL